MKVRLDEQRAVVGRVLRRQSDDGVTVWKTQTAPIGQSVEYLDAGDGPDAEKLEHRWSATGAPYGQSNVDPLGARVPLVTGCCLGDPRPQAARGVREDLPHGLVALAGTGEPRGERDVGDGEVRRLEQDARRLAALRSGECEGTGTELCRDESIELAHAVAELSRQPVHALAIDDAVTDHAHGTGDQVGPHVPLRRAGGCIGSAAQAGPESRLLRGGRRGVEASISSHWSAGWAARAAVDPGRGDSNKEASIEAGILALRRLVATVEIFDHEGIVPRHAANYSRESDMTPPVLADFLPGDAVVELDEGQHFTIQRPATLALHPIHGWRVRSRRLRQRVLAPRYARRARRRPHVDR